MSDTKVSAKLKKQEAALRAIAMAYPEVHEDFPWGHSAFKVKGKAFVFSGVDKGGLSLSLKLPHSCHAALEMPFAEPTGYGLGKSGWVSCKFSAKDDPPMSIIKAWIDESYRAIAPKKLVATLDSGAAVTVTVGKRTPTTKKKTTKKK